MLPSPRLSRAPAPQPRASRRRRRPPWSESSGGQSALNKVATLEETERTAEAADDPRAVPRCERCGTEAAAPYLTCSSCGAQFFATRDSPEGVGAI
eukprot:1481498-Alexandrium_andersonii.AAC.1